MSTISKEVKRLQQAVEPVVLKKVQGRKRKDGTIIDGQVFVAKNPPMAVDNPGKGPKHYGTKDRSKKALMAYLSNPENAWPKKRSDYLKILGLKSTHQYLYKIFTPLELAEIEAEALKIRRSHYSGRSLQVDDGLFEKAKEGNAPEVKLWYQRFEGWSEKTINERRNINIDMKLDPELRALLSQGYPGTFPEVEEKNLDDEAFEIKLLPDDLSQEEADSKE